jgi:transcriptional regulator with XRE-family HTH domain
VNTRSDVLRQVLSETGTTQRELSRLSGVHQPSISQFLSGRVQMSDDMLERLLSCLGYRLEVVRRPVKPHLRRSTERLWRLHRRLSTDMTLETLENWRPTILQNVQLLEGRVHGEPHERNLKRWVTMVNDSDLPALHRTMTGLDSDSVEMREVSPFRGLLTEHERQEVLAGS